MKLRHKYLLSAAPFAVLMLLIIGAGWSREDSRGEANQTAPLVGELDPSQISAGAGDFALTVRGAHFVSGCRLLWNGAERPTEFVNAAVLRARIPASDAASSGIAEVSVANPGFPNEHPGASNTEAFRILPKTSFQK